MFTYINLFIFCRESKNILEKFTHIPLKTLLITYTTPKLYYLSKYIPRYSIISPEITTPSNPSISCYSSVANLPSLVASCRLSSPWKPSNLRPSALVAVEAAAGGFLSKSLAKRHGVDVRIVAGETFDVWSPIYTRTLTMFLDFAMPGAEVQQLIPEGWNAFVYIIDGDGIFDDESSSPASSHHALVLSDGLEQIREVVEVPAHCRPAVE